jgi:hypothetical protein
MVDLDHAASLNCISLAHVASFNYVNPNVVASFIIVLDPKRKKPIVDGVVELSIPFDLVSRK